MIEEAQTGLRGADTGINFARMKKQAPRVRAESIRRVLEEVLSDDVHARRVLSLANATLGVIQAGSLSVSAIGCALADAEGLNAKHAIKQVDRLVGNSGVDVDELFADWVPFVVGPRKEITTAIDWTDFDADGHSSVVLSSISSHGRATPLVWSTVEKSTLKGWRNVHEDTVLKRLAEVVPEGVKVTVLGDRGFGDTGLYALLDGGSAAWRAPVVMDEHVFYESMWSRIRYVLVCATFVGLIVALAITSSGSLHFERVALIGLLVSGLAVSVFYFRSRTTRIIVGERGVEQLTPRKSVALAWTEMTSAELTTINGRRWMSR